MIPPLEWLGSFTNSLGGALGCGVSVATEATVNPLIYRVTFSFSEPLSGPQIVMVWNLFQKYAHKNDSIPQGKMSGWGGKLNIEVIVKRRLGPTKDTHPLE